MIVFRQPHIEDGAVAWDLVQACPELEINPPYTYLLLFDRFGDTCAVAEQGGGVVGFATGFVDPSAHDTLFVWQVAVAEDARRQGIGYGLLEQLLARTAASAVRYLETSLAPTNEAGMALFANLAERLGAELAETDGFPRDSFPKGEHQAQRIVRIGPFRWTPLGAKKAAANDRDG